MLPIRFIALSYETAQAYRNGALDANGQVPERVICDAEGAPCRHCLRDIEVGEPLLILAHRPFPFEQPYAETGPIFLHAEECPRYLESGQVPAMFLKREHMLIRGYGDDHRIRYGTGTFIPTSEIPSAAAALLEREDVAYVHLRSAGYNCYQCAVMRA